MPTSLLKILMTESPRKLLDAHWNLVGQVRAPAAQPHRFDDAPSMEVVSAIAHEAVFGDDGVLNRMPRGPGSPRRIFALKKSQLFGSSLAPFGRLMFPKPHFLQ